MKIGAAFLENIHTERRYFTNKSKFRFEKTSTLRIILVPIFIIFFSLILFGRLFFLQIIKGQYYHGLSDSNRLRTALIHAPRGVIFDRNGKALVFNTPGFREVINGKIQLLNQQEALAKIAQGDKHLEVDRLRNYPYKDVFGHIIGYTGQISPDELKQKKNLGYQPDDLVGELGIEQQYQNSLRGVDGRVLVEVDAMGKILRFLGQTDPFAGKNITLTLDADLQQKVFDATANVHKGAVIVSTPQGEIRAMVSRPSFDPNLFTMGKSYHPSNGPYSDISQILLDNQNQPLLNRPIAGVYPPGSTFKLVVAAAGLADGVIDEKYTVEDTGVLKLGDFSFANWFYTQYGGKDGSVNIIKAIQRSNDIFFYTVGHLLGVDRLSTFAQKFGLGARLGLDLPGEAKGLVPTKEWKKKVIGENWYTGDDYHYGIGQGYLLTTPLQVNAWTQAIANGGSLYQPHLLASQTPHLTSQNLLSSKNFDVIRQGMLAACSSGGVAYPLFNVSVKNKNLVIDGKNILEAPNATASAQEASASAGLSDYRRITVACKTGTAEHGDAQAKPHAWITLFAPAYNPQVVVTVLVEDGGEGSEAAAPIAKKVLEAWFEK